MSDQDSKTSFWTSLPGILTGVAALVTALSGLAVWQHKSTPDPNPPKPTPVVQAVNNVQPTPAVQLVSNERGVPSQEMSTLCQFETGPRAGQTQDYATQAPLPVGADCHDGQGSGGHVIGRPGQGAAEQQLVTVSGPQSREWCMQKLSEWSTKNAQGTDDAGLRTSFREGKCGQQYGLRLGKPTAKE